MYETPDPRTMPAAVRPAITKAAEAAAQVLELGAERDRTDKLAATAEDDYRARVVAAITAGTNPGDVEDDRGARRLAAEHASLAYYAARNRMPALWEELRLALVEHGDACRDHAEALVDQAAETYRERLAAVRAAREEYATALGLRRWVGSALQPPDHLGRPRRLDGYKGTTVTAVEWRDDKGTKQRGDVGTALAILDADAAQLDAVHAAETKAAAREAQRQRGVAHAEAIRRDHAEQLARREAAKAARG
jgi:hypothetical protein